MENLKKRQKKDFDDESDESDNEYDFDSNKAKSMKEENQNNHNVFAKIIHNLILKNVSSFLHYILYYVNE